MDPAKIERINALARKKKEQGLTESEAAEQEALRKEYLKEIRKSLKATLDRVYLEQEDGSYKKLEKKGAGDKRGS